MTRKPMPAMDAALRLGKTYRRLLDDITTGRLKGWREAGRWYCDERDVERLRREREAEAVAR